MSVFMIFGQTMSYIEVKSPEDFNKPLRDSGFISTEEINTVLFLSTKLKKPIFIEGPVGSGKTFLAKAFADAYNKELIRLQCYEGLDESKTIYEWEYSKQLLFTQMLKGKIENITKKSKSIDEAISSLLKEKGFFSEDFLIPRPLLRALKRGNRAVLLIDEIDKADAEFEAFLLEILSEFTISIPEVGTIKAETMPYIFLTSNDSREISDALKRRCLYLYMDTPEREMLENIINIHIPDAREKFVSKVIGAIEKIRRLQLNRQPSIGEIVDWVRSLVIFSAGDISEELFIKTLNGLLKDRQDLSTVKKSINSILKEE